MKRKKSIVILSVLAIILTFINSFNPQNDPTQGLLTSNNANVYHSSVAPSFNLGAVKSVQFLIKKGLRFEHSLKLSKDHKFMILEQSLVDNKEWSKYLITIQSFVEGTVNFPQFSVETKDLSTSKVTKNIITTLPKQVNVVSNILDKDSAIERAPLMTLIEEQKPEDKGFNYLLLLVPIIIVILIVRFRRSPEIVEEDPHAELKAVIATLKSGADILPNQLQFNDPVIDTFFYAKNSPEAREKLINFLENQLGGQNES